MRPDELVAVAAWLYYQGGLKQEEVARRLGVSRVKVARLLVGGLPPGVVPLLTPPPPSHPPP
ncbi:hypothetical protein, partial [Oceanithermus sp.]